MPTRQEQHLLNRPRHIVAKLVGLAVVTLAFAAGAYGLRLYSQAKYAIQSTYHSSGKVATAIKNKRPFAALLLGVDTGADGRIDKGNSDTMIVAVVNPAKKQTQLVSIPRDTVAQMIGTKSFNMQKINAAYNIGGSTMAINTVTKLVNVPISYYLTINMGALEKVVDAVGGVDVQVPFSFTSSKTGGQHFTKGKMHLNGNMALAYARMRYEDPKGDYGRQQRQQQVIKAILKKAVSLDSLSNFSSLLNTVSKNIATNLSFDDMMSIFQHYRGAAQHIQSDHLQGQAALVYPGPLSYQIPSTKELQRVSTKLRTALGLSAATISNQNVRENNANSSFQWNVDQDQTYTIFNPDL
ncbi:LCP family glycopolymer transferase [Lacticaseibacillus nasuensis]|uniref:LCP family glycopolymer transferase n=1 Tax=Lacticaseibacillus nasuensis TaxID=944671 RepID=UPI00224572BD|nr:LCP family protein [Lacticaseibacillus nasuensis]MCX2454452.1 LCP family protein [Lacticaseibacillus nasuensis]